MKNCPKCNHPVIGSAKFCQKCGAALSGENAPSKSAEQVSRKLPPAPPPKKKIIIKEPEVVVPDPRVEPAKKNLWVFAVFGGVVLLALYGVFHSSEESQPVSLPADLSAPAPAPSPEPVNPPPAPVPPDIPESPRAAASVAPHGYAAIYQAEGDNNGWQLGAGYQTQEQAENETLSNCQKNYPAKSCVKRVSGAYRCAAVGISSVWLSWNLGDDLESLKSGVIASCKEHGGDCVISPNQQLCASW